MGFRINTNIAAMNAHRNSVQTNLGLDKSLQALSSGLRINTAADDASGLAIANSLRAQSTGLGQAINNANDGIGVTQTADGALDEYENIINTVRTKSIQAASDGQNDDSRAAIQRDIGKLLDEADNIAKTTSFNGLNLLDGSYSDKHFQIGAYSNETVDISISSARTSSVGQYAEATGTTALAGTDIVDGALILNGTSIAAASVGANTLGQALDSAFLGAKSINAQSTATGVTAKADTTMVGVQNVVGGSFTAGDIFVNGTNLGDVVFSANDSTGSLVAAFNAISDTTGVKASIVDSKLQLKSDDGSNITLSLNNTGATVMAVADANMLGYATNATTLGTNVYENGSGTATAAKLQTWGEITVSSDNAIAMTGTAETSYGFTDSQNVTLANAISSVNVSTYDGAQKGIKQADAALKQIDSIRSNIGSTQNQLESTIRNISVTQVNVAAAESQIRDVDFAAESANFAKFNILAQSGSYAMSQANAVQQNVMRLLQ